MGRQPRCAETAGPEESRQERPAGQHGSEGRTGGRISVIKVKGSPADRVSVPSLQMCRYRQAVAVAVGAVQGDDGIYRAGFAENVQSGSARPVWF